MNTYKYKIYTIIIINTVNIWSGAYMTDTSVSYIRQNHERNKRQLITCIIYHSTVRCAFDVNIIG